jgi:hypothetical protein
MYLQLLIVFCCLFVSGQHPGLTLQLQQMHFAIVFILCQFVFNVNVVNSCIR